MKYSITIALIFISIGLCACGKAPQAGIMTETPIVTATLNPSSTPTLTLLPTLTSTPLPTSTSSPTPTPFGGASLLFANYGLSGTTGDVTVYMTDLFGNRSEIASAWPADSNPQGRVGISWSPNGQLLAFMDNNGLNLFDLNTKTIEQLGKTEGGGLIIWSPDSQKIIVVDNRSGRYFRTFLIGKKGRSYKIAGCEPQWSSDGNNIFFHQVYGGCATNIVYQSDLTGQNVKSIDLPERLPALFFLSDNTFLTVLESANVPSEIAKVSFDGKQKQSVFQLPIGEWPDVEISPDQKWLIVIGEWWGERNGYQSDSLFWLVNLETLESRDLSVEQPYYCPIDWSPDGQDLIGMNAELIDGITKTVVTMDNLVTGERIHQTVISDYKDMWGDSVSNIWCAGETSARYSFDIGWQFQQ
jgi:Tol biopolymer transport system component